MVERWCNGRSWDWISARKKSGTRARATHSAPWAGLALFQEVHPLWAEFEGQLGLSLSSLRIDVLQRKPDTERETREDSALSGHGHGSRNSPPVSGHDSESQRAEACTSLAQNHGYSYCALVCARVMMPVSTIPWRLHVVGGF